MNDVLKNAVPALVALVGTVLAILIGYRQWKRQQDATLRSEFRTQKQHTYRELWEKLEDVHVRLRTELVGNDEFNSLVRDVNSYILKHGLYLENDDQALANRYLSKVREFTSLVTGGKSARTKKALQNTEEIPIGLVRLVQDLDKVQTEVNQVREEILVRYRKVLSGNISSK